MFKIVVLVAGKGFSEIAVFEGLPKIGWGLWAPGFNLEGRNKEHDGLPHTHPPPQKNTQ